MQDVEQILSSHVTLSFESQKQHTELESTQACLEKTSSVIEL